MPLDVEISGTIVSNVSGAIDANITSVAAELSSNVAYLADDMYVPFRVGSSARITSVADASINKAFRDSAVMYVDNNTNKRMTLTQVKNMSTKVLTTNTQSDIANLDVGDFVFLRQQ